MPNRLTDHLSYRRRSYDNQTFGRPDCNQDGRSGRNNKERDYPCRLCKRKTSVAEVVAVGPGGVVDGKEIKMYLKPGDRVLMSKYAGTEVKLDGQEFTILRQDDVLAIVE